MFSFFKKTKTTQELDKLITEIQMDMENNYKDLARQALEELKQKIEQLTEQGVLTKREIEKYTSIANQYDAKMVGYSHKDQKPYWTRD